MGEHEVECSSLHENGAVLKAGDQTAADQRSVVGVIVLVVVAAYALLYHLDARGQHQRHFV